MGKIPNVKKRLVFYAAYLPPKLPARTYHAAFRYIADSIDAIKLKMKGPYLLLTGDFNKCPVSECTDKFDDLEDIPSMGREHLR